ncbi:hypothetical protein SDC9_205413 [bioreactor metagenome]|uniref:Uncharacterized protein n=1 Tax=bioreactor metagenome TaxID=1076179 RepID=A0A645J4U8_9ZZZZ
MVPQGVVEYPTVSPLLCPDDRHLYDSVGGMVPIDGGESSSGKDLHGGVDMQVVLLAADSKILHIPRQFT